MAWYHVIGKEQDVAIASGVSFLRSVADCPFPARMEVTALRELADRMEKLLQKSGFTRHDFADISHSSAYSMAEAFYVSYDFIKLSRPHSLFLNKPCDLAISVGGQDHIELRSVLSGLSCEEALTAAQQIEEPVDEAIPFAFHETYGYLTQDPTRLGSGMNAWVLLSVPLLVGSEEFSGYVERCQRIGLEAQATEDLGILRLSNRTSLGEREEITVSKLKQVALSLIERERALRSSAQGEARDRLLDRSKRAMGILRTAHILTTEETVSLLGDVRLGISMGCITEIRVEAVNAALFETMPATMVSSLDREPVSAHEYALMRAKTIRRVLFGDAST